jgi:hypothetical protein
MRIRAIRNEGDEFALRKPLWLNIFVPVVLYRKSLEGLFTIEDSPVLRLQACS